MYRIGGILYSSGYKVLELFGFLLRKFGDLSILFLDKVLYRIRIYTGKGDFLLGAFQFLDQVRDQRGVQKEYLIAFGFCFSDIAVLGFFVLSIKNDCLLVLIGL